MPSYLILFFLGCVKNLIGKVTLEYVNENPQISWEICKIKIKEFAMKYSKQKQSQQKLLS